MAAEPANQAFRTALGRYAGWVRERALPLWGMRALDEVRGGFFESLDFQGRPIADAVRRVRVQARQIHVFATASRLGWQDGEGTARAGFDYVLDRACPERGARGCVHRLAPDGAVLDAKRDLYDQAFLLLACAAMKRAFNDERAMELARATVAFLDRELASSDGGYYEDDEKSQPRRQNPHMHLFEAFMALFEATGDAQFLRRAGEMRALFEQKFFDSRLGVVREFFDAAWNLDERKGDVLEPGHMAEWVWLLARHEKVSRRSPDRSPLLFKNAAAFGADDQGFLVDEAAIGAKAGGPRRLWPQTEYLKACIARAGAGDDQAAKAGARLVERLFETYLAEPVAGLWCDRYDHDGARMAKDVPASILYHLFDAAIEAQFYLDRA